MAHESVNFPKRAPRAGPLPWLVLAVGFALVPSAAAQPGPGYVGSQAFIDVAGDDGVKVQVSVGASLLRMFSNADPSLKELAGGLESIEAVILDLNRRGVAERARAALRETESRLLKRGWERLVLVREDDADLRVLVLNDETSIQGLVVMIVDAGDGEMVFANISGRLDLSAIEEIGQRFEIPGLEDIEIDPQD